MSLTPPPPERSKVGDAWVDPITADRWEFTGDETKGTYEAQTRLAQVLGWGDFRECSAAQTEEFAAWAQEVGLPHLGNPHIRKELFT